MADGIDLGIDGLSDYEEIGTGGFATVFSALEAQVGRRVAVKVLASVDEAGRRRFDRERLTMGQTSEHPNIVTLLRSGYLGPDRNHTPYLVMEYMAGGSLADRLAAGGPMPWAEAIDAVLPIASALGFSHGAGILHKDVKPANILVSRTGVVKLSDFGVAAIREASGTSQVAFSILYTAPESFHAQHHPDSGDLVDPRDERSDLYSLATTLYTLGTGRPPFQGATSAALMRQILHEPVPPTGIAPLDTFFARALAKAPEGRHTSAAELIEDLLVVRDAPLTAEVTASLAMASPPGHHDGAGRPDPGPTPDDPPTAVHDLTEQWREGLATGAAAGGVAPGSLAAGGDGGDPPRSTGAADRRPPVELSRRSVAVLAVFAVAAVAAGLAIASQVVGNGAFAGVEPGVFRGHAEFADDENEDAVHAVVVLPGDRVATSAGDGSVQVWDPARPDDEPLVFTGHRDLAADAANDAVYALAALPGGRLASGGVDDTVQVWDPARPGEPATVYRGHTADVQGLAVLDDQRLASASRDGTVQVWDPDDPAAGPAAAYRGHEGDVWVVIQLADGRIASGGSDGTVQLWDPDQPSTPSAVYTGHRDRAPAQPSDDTVRALTQLTDGRIASAGEDGTVQLWDPAQPSAPAAVYTGHRDRAANPAGDTVRAVTQLADGLLASAGEDGAVHLWDPDDPVLALGLFTGHTVGSVNTVRQLSDTLLASGGEDGTVRIWDPTDLTPPA